MTYPERRSTISYQHPVWYAERCNLSTHASLGVLLSRKLGSVGRIRPFVRSAFVIANEKSHRQDAGGFSVFSGRQPRGGLAIALSQAEQTEQAEECHAEGCGLWYWLREQDLVVVECDSV